MQRNSLRLALGVSGFYTHTGHEEDCPDIGPQCQGSNPPASEWHDLKLTFLLVRLEAEYGITDWLSIDALGFIRTTDVGFQLQDYATRAPIAGTDIHHRSETITGAADPWISARAWRRMGEFTLAGRLGFTIPIGSTVPDPFELGRMGLPHEHIQYGTGTWDPIVGGDLSWKFVDAFAISRLPLYANDYGYQGGARVIGGAGGGHDFGPLHVRLGLDIAWESAETWHGAVETEGNLGRTDLLVDAGGRYSFGSAWAATLTARVPLYTRAEGAQLSIPATVELALERTLRF